MHTSPKHEYDTICLGILFCSITALEPFQNHPKMIGYELIKGKTQRTPMHVLSVFLTLHELEGSLQSTHND